MNDRVNDQAGRPDPRTGDQLRHVMPREQTRGHDAA